MIGTYEKFSFLLIVAVAGSSLIFDLNAFALNCGNPTTQADMNACSDKEARQAEGELSIVYKSVWKRMDGKDRAGLKAEEKLWLAYRENECAFEAQDSIGGNMYRLELNSCYEKLTKIRIDELNAIKK